MVRPNSAREGSVGKPQIRCLLERQPSTARSPRACPQHQPPSSTGIFQCAARWSKARKHDQEHLAMDQVLFAAQKDLSPRWDGVNAEYPPLRLGGFSGPRSRCRQTFAVTGSRNDDIASAVLPGRPRTRFIENHLTPPKRFNFVKSRVCRMDRKFRLWLRTGIDAIWHTHAGG